MPAPPFFFPSYESTHCFYSFNIHAHSKPPTSSFPSPSLAHLFFFLPKPYPLCSDVPVRELLLPYSCSFSYAMEIGKDFWTITWDIGVITVPWSSWASNYTFSGNETSKVNVSIGSCQHSLSKQHLFMVKHNFARGAVELSDTRMWALYCTSASSWPFLSAYFFEQPQRTVWSVLHRWKYWHYTVYCSCNSYITLGCVCGWDGGSGRLGAWGLLNLSIYSGKAAAWARPGPPPPTPIFWIDLFLMSCSSPCRAGVFNEVRPTSQAVCGRVELLINH